MSNNIFCSECGNKNSLTSNFCSGCGNPLKANIKAKMSVVVEDDDEYEENSSGSYPSKLGIQLEGEPNKDFRRPMNEAFFGPGAGSVIGARQVSKLSKKEKNIRKQSFKQQLAQTRTEISGDE